MKMSKTLFYLCFTLLFMLVTGIFETSYAGGPLFVGSNGKPILWSKLETKGGVLGSSTVNPQGQVLYRVDGGALGTIPGPEAVKLVDRIFKLYTDIPTSSIEFVNAGTIKNPQTNAPIDVDRTNMGLILNSRNPTFQNPIIFDSDGGITGRGGVLGFFTFLAFVRDDPSTIALGEATVVLNGASINAAGGKVPFLGVFTHEFGHFAGPLDHSQVNGGIASSSSFANLPDGFSSSEQRFDVFGPFVETVYPFLFGGPSSSKLGNLGFRSSGNFIASLDFDDVIAMSALYPAPGYLPSEPGSKVGGITGKIAIKTPDGDFPITGLNVVARRISLGKYPPDPTIEVFKGGNIPLDADGAPLPPEPRPELDSLATATSFVSGVLRGDGTYQFIGLPPGDYLVSVEKINPNFLFGSSVGPREEQLDLTTPESYNGASESNASTDNPKDFTPVKVVAGSITPNIDIFLNGFGTTSIAAITESEPNDAKKQGQKINLDSRVRGSIKASDSSKISLMFDNGSLPVQDLYRVDLRTPSQLYISLEADNINSDIDVVLFTKSIKNGAISINSSFVLNAGLTITGSELIGSSTLAAGTYYIGIASGQDTANYTLTVFGKK
jgi:hypothetical protein